MRKQNILSVLTILLILLISNPADLFSQAQTQTLGQAVHKKDTALVLQLIKAGANPNELDQWGSSPLMTACRWGDVQMVKLLLANGAKVDEPRSPKGRTALMVACAYYSGTEVCKLLIENGADVNALADNGTTALMLAAGASKLDVVEYLLSKKADATKKDISGKTALDYAMKADPSIYGKEGLKGAVIDKEGIVSLLKK